MTTLGNAGYDVAQPADAIGSPPARTSEQRDFWTAVAGKYDRVVDLQIGSKVRAMIRERVAHERPLGHVVEFGCGTGFYTSVLASKATTVMATDLSPGMLALAKQQTAATNVTFQLENCEQTSLPDAAFDTAFISLVIHFTDPTRTVAEMHRILKPGGMLIIANLDPIALHGLDRIRSLIRVLYHGVTGYRLKPPKRFGQNAMTEQQLSDLLNRSRFRVVSSETIRDCSSPSSIPVEYVRAMKA